MLPILSIPDVIKSSLSKYRDIFRTTSSFRHIGKYITNLLVNQNKTLQGAHYNVIDLDKPVTRRAMHYGVFGSNWDDEGLIPHHRTIVSKDHQGQHGKEVIVLDWTFSHHDRGPKIYGNKIMYDYGKGCYSLLQTVLTATAANKKYIDGIDFRIHLPSNRIEEEKLYLKDTQKSEYLSLCESKSRLIELLSHREHVLSYKKKSDLFIEMVTEIEEEGKNTHSNYVLDNGVLQLGLVRCIENYGKHWVSELEVSRNVNWKGNWLRLDNLAKELKNNPEINFREIKFTAYNGKEKRWRCFTKVLKLKGGYGKKRIVICYENNDLSGKPRFLITDANHWDPIKILTTWSYRWPCEIFHEFAKQDAGLESAQVRKEKSVKRHFSLSYVAQSILQRIKAPVSKCDRFMFAKGKQTIGQNTMVLVRSVFKQSIELAIKLSKEGKTIDEIVGILLPI